MAGPLAGLRIIEFAGLGPGPFCATMLADNGAEVIRIERPGADYASASADPDQDVMMRSRSRLAVDLKDERAFRLVRELCRSADGIIEGFRPGVMERLGLGPNELLADNPALAYGRMTGWGQSGMLADTPGHDINYVALSGVLHALGRVGEKPTPPLNLLGDYGGGLMLAFGMVSAILNARHTGQGQVVDCAMVDSSAMLGSVLWTFQAQGNWVGPRGTNLFDTGAHHYDTYECGDGHFIALGAIEPQFYAALRKLLCLDADSDFDQRENPVAWTHQKAKLAVLFKTRSREEWCELLEGSDACFAPVLSPGEAASHPHNVERNSFVCVEGAVQPAPCPRFMGTPSSAPTPPMRADLASLKDLLAGAGSTHDEIAELMASGAIS